MADGNVIIVTTLDTSGVERGVGSLESKLKSSLKGVGVAFAALGAAAIAGVTGAFKLAESASDLSEAQNVVQQTFKTSNAQVLEWTKSMAESAGISETMATKWVGSMGAMLKSSGLTEDAAASMSEQMVQLAGDFASFYNISQDDAWEKIRSGISGETEPLKQLGINMSVANLEAYALSQGINKSWNEMSQAEQTTLRYNYLLSVTKDAQGDFGRTLETSFPNQLRVAQMQLQSLGTTIGQEFLPIFLESFKKINQGIKDQDWAAVGEGVADAITGVLQKIAEMAPQFAEMAAELIASLVEGIVEGLPKLVEGITTLINKLVQKIIELAPKLIPAAVKAVAELAKGFIQALPKIVDAGIKIILELIKALTKELPKLIPVAVQAIIQLVNGLVQNISLIVEAAVELILALAQGLIQAIPALIQAVPKIVTALCEQLANSVGLIVQAGIQLLMGIVEAIPVIVVEIAKAVPQIIGAIVTGLFEGIGQIFEAALSIFGIIVDTGKSAMQQLDEAVENNLKAAESWKKAWDEAGNSMEGLEEVLSSSGKTMGDVNAEIDRIQGEINKILQRAAAERRGLRNSEIKQIAGYNDEILRLQQEQLEIYQRQQHAALTKAGLEGATLSKENAAALLKEAKSGYDAVVEYADKIYTARIAQLEQQKNSIVEQYGQAHYDKLLRQAQTHHTQAVQEAKNTYNETVKAVQEGTQTWLATETDAFTQLQNLGIEREKIYQQISDQAGKSGYEQIVASQQTTEALNANKNETAKILTDIINAHDNASIETTGAWLQMQLGIARDGGKMTNTAKTTAIGILDAFDGLPEDMDEEGRKVLLSMIAGWEDEIPGLDNAANMTTDEILTALRRYLGITGNSSTKTETMGANLGEGINVGYERKVRQILQNIISITQQIVAAAQKAAQVKSPSKATIWMGEMLGAGFGIGYEREMKKTGKLMQRVTSAEIARIQAGIALGDIRAQIAAGNSTTYAPQYHIKANQPIGQREILRQIQLDQQRQRLYAL